METEVTGGTGRNEVNPTPNGTWGRRRRRINNNRWEDNIKVDLREVGYDPGEWIDLAEDRDLWRAYIRAVMNLRVP